MPIPFLKLPISTTGVAQLNQADVKDYFLDAADPRGSAHWDFRLGKFTLSSIINPRDVLTPKAPVDFTWSDKYINMKKASGNGGLVAQSVKCSDAKVGHTAFAVLRINTGTNMHSVIGDYVAADYSGAYIEISSTGQALLHKGGVDSVYKEMTIAFPTTTSILGEWVFLAYSIKSGVNSIGTANCILKRQGNPIQNSTITIYTKDYVAGKSGIGVQVYSNGNENIDFSEVGFIDNYSSTEQLNELYLRTKERMQLKGVDI